MRIMGLDFGSKTTGVAVSDPLGITAQGIETITRKDENKLRQTCARIEELIREYEVGTIVLGYPKNMNNTLGERVEKTLAFKEMLERRTPLSIKICSAAFVVRRSSHITTGRFVRRSSISLNASVFSTRSPSLFCYGENRI